MTELEIHIRSAVPADLASMIHVEQQAERMFPLEDLPASPCGPAPDAAYLAAIRGSIAWVAERGSGEIVGFIACTRVDAFLHILEIDVLPGFGRQGVGRALLARACAAATAMPRIDGVTLTTFRHLPWNQPFYEKHGFEPVPDAPGIRHLADLLRDEEHAGLRNRVGMLKKAQAWNDEKSKQENFTP